MNSLQILTCICPLKKGIRVAISYKYGEILRFYLYSDRLGKVPTRITPNIDNFHAVYTSNSSKGCVLEVDLEYSKELHKLHIGYPLAPDITEIKRKMMSEYQLKIADLYNVPIREKNLVSNLLGKEKYATHFENLQLHFRLGLKLKTIRRVL